MVYIFHNSMTKETNLISLNLQNDHKDPKTEAEKRNDQIKVSRRKASIGHIELIVCQLKDNIVTVPQTKAERPACLLLNDDNCLSLRRKKKET